MTPTGPAQTTTEPLQVSVAVSGDPAQLTQQQKDEFVQNLLSALDHALRPAAPQPEAAPTGGLTGTISLTFKF